MNSNYRIQFSEFVNETSTNSVILFIIYIDDVTNNDHLCEESLETFGTNRVCTIRNFLEN